MWLTELLGYFKKLDYWIIIHFEADLVPYHTLKLISHKIWKSFSALRNYINCHILVKLWTQLFTLKICSPICCHCMLWTWAKVIYRRTTWASLGERCDEALHEHVTCMCSLSWLMYSIIILTIKMQCVL